MSTVALADMPNPTNDKPETHHNMAVHPPMRKTAVEEEITNIPKNTREIITPKSEDFISQFKGEAPATCKWLS